MICSRRSPIRLRVSRLVAAALVGLVTLQAAVFVPRAQARAGGQAATTHVQEHSSMRMATLATDADAMRHVDAGSDESEEPAPGSMPEPCEPEGPCEDGLLRCSAGNCVAIPFIAALGGENLPTPRTADAEIGQGPRLPIPIVSSIPSPPPKR